MLWNGYQSCNLIGLYPYLGNKPKKFGFVYPRVFARRHMQAGPETSLACPLKMKLGMVSLSPRPKTSMDHFQYYTGQDEVWEWD